jgi:very-short-patch-repair endonuclease
MPADLDRRVEELASTQLGLFSVRQVLLLGATISMVRARTGSGRWSPRGFGVLGLLGTPDTFDRRVLAEILGARCPTYASHRCAARLHGLPGFPERIEVLGGVGTVAQRAGVIGHRTRILPPHHVEVRNAVPVTTVARTLFDLSAVAHPGRVARAVDTALGRRIVTIPELVRVTQDLARRGRSRVRVMRAILADRGVDERGPESPLEALFVELLRTAGLPQPARQVDLGDALSWIGRVDFVYRAERVVVETDGHEHHSQRLDLDADARRDARLAAAGWTVLRFGWEDVVGRPVQTVERLRAALTRAA